MSPLCVTRHCVTASWHWPVHCVVTRLPQPPGHGGRVGQQRLARHVLVTRHWPRAQAHVASGARALPEKEKSPRVDFFLFSLPTWMLKSLAQSCCRGKLSPPRSQRSRWSAPWDKLEFLETKDKDNDRHLEHVLPRVSLVQRQQGPALCHSAPVENLMKKHSSNVLPVNGYAWVVVEVPQGDVLDDEAAVDGHGVAALVAHLPDDVFHPGASSPGARGGEVGQDPARPHPPDDDDDSDQWW